jgi:hypothetical protein
VAQFRRTTQAIKLSQLTHQGLDSRLAALHKTAFETPAIVSRGAVCGPITIELVGLESRVKHDAIE